MMRESKSYNKHPTYRDRYDALVKSPLMDEDGIDRGEEKQRRKEADLPKKSSTAKESSKGKTPPKTSKTGKSMTAEESFEEPVHEVAMDVEEPALDDVVNDVVQPQDDVDPKKDNST
nr:hypothetical protein [Tanacetum cinerariifolium]